MEDNDENQLPHWPMPWPLPRLDGALDNAGMFSTMLSDALHAAVKDSDEHMYTPERSPIGDARLALINLWLWKTARRL